MNKYHINPETGNPGLCSAKINCPFGGDDVHYFSKEAAQKAFEDSTKSEALKVWKKKVNHTPDDSASTPTISSGTGYGFHGGVPSTTNSSPAPITGHGGFHGYTSPPAPAKTKTKPVRTPVDLGHGRINYGGHGSY